MGQLVEMKTELRFGHGLEERWLRLRLVVAWESEANC
jgi:hypothetical protein